MTQRTSEAPSSSQALWRMTTDKEDLGIQAQERVPRPSRSGSKGINRQSCAILIQRPGHDTLGKMLLFLPQGEARMG